jgi:hypothetical protein
MAESFLDWHGKLWEREEGDGEAEVAAAERRLGFALPKLLREVYRHTALRDGQMLHLIPLDELQVADGALPIVREQQGVFCWAIPVGQMEASAPKLVANPGDEWVDDGCTLEDLLRFFALANRPYEGPCIAEAGFDPGRLRGWHEHRVEWGTLHHSLWTNGEAVLEPEAGDLGARDEAALRRAAASIGVDEEEIIEALEG